MDNSGGGSISLPVQFVFWSNCLEILNFTTKNTFTHVVRIEMAISVFHILFTVAV